MHRQVAAHDVVVVTEAHSDDGRVAVLAHELPEFHIVATHSGDDSGGVIQNLVMESGRCLGVRWRLRERSVAVVGIHLVSHASHDARRRVLQRIRDWCPHPIEGWGFVGGDFNTVAAGEARLHLQTGLAVPARDPLEQVFEEVLGPTLAELHQSD